MMSNNFELLKIIKLKEKEIWVRKVELKIVDAYLKKADFSKTLNLDKLGNKEYKELKNEIGATNAIPTIEKVIVQHQYEIQEMKKAMRNPKQKKDGKPGRNI